MKANISGDSLHSRAVQARDPGDLVIHALPWVLEAGNPYYESLFGSLELAKRVLDAWMRRPTSEVSISRVQFLACEQEFAGGFVALDAAELRKARKADSISLLNAVSLTDRTALMQRMRNLADLFPPVADDEYYLSKLGLNPRFRGRGLSRMLVARYLENGRMQGYTRYRLDVAADNEAAIHCYQSAGFRLFECSRSKDGTFRYCAMRYELVSV